MEKYKEIWRENVDDEYVVIFGKIVKESKPKRCADCNHAIFADFCGVGVCRKYKGIISKADTCIEEGM